MCAEFPPLNKQHVVEKKEKEKRLKNKGKITWLYWAQQIELVQSEQFAAGGTKERAKN